MKQEYYKLANRLNLWEESGYDYEGRLDEASQQKYRDSALASIRRERKARRKKRFTAAAACLVLLSALAFNSEVQATVANSLGSIRAFLGIQSDFSKYTKTINTSVSNNGYLATLKEVVVADEKVAVSYTLQRENGRPFPCTRTLATALYVDGQEIYAGTGFTEPLDKEKKIQGTEMTFNVLNLDLSKERDYQLKVSDYSGGKWEFSFKADGAELHADTKRIEIGQKFSFPDGSQLTLFDLTSNAFEQRVNYYKSYSTKYYDVKLNITDDQGRNIYFDDLWYGKSDSYLSNDGLNGSGYLSKSAKTATAEVLAVEFDESEGKIGDWIKIGEFTLDLSNLQ